MPILPPEICDYIIDCLKGDYSTLMTCMLVCKSWAPRSRHNLPHFMHFDCHEKVVQVAQHSGTLWKGPEIVHVWGRDNSHDKPIHHLSTFAAMLAGRWTRVKQLRIISARWRAGDMTPEVFLHLSTFSSVVNLGLDHVAFQSIVTLRRLICCFPNLQTLLCHNLSFRRHSAVLPESAKWPQALSSLNLRGYGASSLIPIAKLLLDAGLVTHLHHLRFEHWSVDSLCYARELPALQKLMNTAGTSLSTFDLDVGCNRDWVAKSPKIRASISFHCPNCVHSRFLSSCSLSKSCSQFQTGNLDTASSLGL